MGGLKIEGPVYIADSVHTLQCSLNVTLTLQEARATVPEFL